MEGVKCKKNCKRGKKDIKGGVCLQENKTDRKKLQGHNVSEKDKNRGTESRIKTDDKREEK
jgi:hypothetical protein